ncbi:MAG: 4-deoxy-4-formamido-L-arabinose-phosphoundecaprenol deformylase, partial [Proteobacteria bacterium]|nr:4-deoxy-4-formamido-L-arabinose-phosphoundecaprenol deformylase [Pseudomonadota bacterium]
CAAAPAWRITDTALKQREKFAFHYNSDCRGQSVFYPLVEGRTLSRPQVPTTLPTYDELIGRNGITSRNYNEHLIKLFRPGRLNVLTIHAEAEGISCLGLFQDFLKKARQRGITLAPLMDMLDSSEAIGTSAIVPGRVGGRDGWISSQETGPRP